MKKPVIKSFIILAVTLVSSIFCGNRLTVPIAHFIFLFFALQFIIRTPSSVGWLILTVPTTIILTIVDWGIVPVPEPVVQALPWLLTVLMTTAAMVLHKIAGQRIKNFSATLIFPGIYTLLSYIYAQTNVFGSWDHIAYKFTEYKGLIQMVSVTGIWGVGFLIAWTVSVADWVWLNRNRPDKLRTGMTIFSIVIFSALLFGQLRYSTRDYHVKTVKVAGITQSEEIQSGLEKKYGGFEHFLQSVKDGRISTISAKPILKAVTDDLFSKTRTAVRGGAKIIFWSEAAGMVFNQDQSNLIEEGKIFSKEHGIYLGMSVYTLFPDPSARINHGTVNNHIIFISPSGEVTADFIKQRPTPGEVPYNVIKVDKVPLIKTTYGNVSFAICFDGDFHDLIRQGKDASLFFMPSKDWAEITPIHSKMASLRAVENGFHLIRPSSTGLSAAYDQYGVKIAEASDLPSRQGGIFYADIPMNSTRTIYEMFGDYFPFLSGLMAGFLILAGFIRKKEAQQMTFVF